MRTNKTISLAIDEYEELFEILMNSLKNVDERFREEVRIIFIPHIVLYVTDKYHKFH